MSNDQPFCSECQKYMVQLRADGTLPIHRDGADLLCEGSRKAPDWRKGAPIKKEGGTQAWRWLGSNNK
jgi:hypothetical protein